MIRVATARVDGSLYGAGFLQYHLDVCLRTFVIRGSF